MKIILVAIILSCVGLGCRSTHLAYVYDASVGLDVAYSQNGNPKVVFGYDRGTYALVPQRDDVAAPCEKCPNQDPPHPSERGELMTLTGVSRVHVNGLGDLQFDHFVATGAAAQRVAKDHVGLKQIRKAIFDEEGGE